jgi:hypothetical protein
MFKFYICSCCLYGMHMKQFMLQHFKSQKHQKNKFLNGRQPISDELSRDMLSKHYSGCVMKQPGMQIKFIIV